MGIGGLLGRRHILEAMPPYQFGGDMIEFVRDEESTWNALPHKFEAGTPNVADAVGLAAACDYLDGLGHRFGARARAGAGAADDGPACARSTGCASTVRRRRSAAAW